MLNPVTEYISPANSRQTVDNDRICPASRARSSSSRVISFSASLLVGARYSVAKIYRRSGFSFRAARVCYPQLIFQPCKHRFDRQPLSCAARFPVTCLPGSMNLRTLLPSHFYFGICSPPHSGNRMHCVTGEPPSNLRLYIEVNGKGGRVCRV